MIMIYPLMAIIVYLLLCYASDTDPFFRRSEAAAVRDLILDWQNGWAYPSLENIPAMVEELKKQTGLPVRLVLRWSDSGQSCSRIYPGLDIDGVEAFLREQIEKGKGIDDTRVRTIISEKLPPLFGFNKAPSHICVSMRFDEAGQPIDVKATMDVIKKIFDYREAK